MTIRWISGGVTAAAGFTAAGLTAGIKPSRKPDLALVVSPTPVTAAAVFTTNRVQAAPVRISAARIRAARARAVFINSGCANCLTGPAGRQDALRISRAVAQELGIAERDLLIASTGLIGSRLPVPKVLRAIPRLVAKLGRSSHAAAARGILTTDRRTKEAAVAATIDGQTCRVGGMAKGAGMLAPSMATMLCVITTDVKIGPTLMRTILRDATDETFNRISVDGDMSTNDTVFALASNRSGVAIRPRSAGARTFARMVKAVTGRLATLMVQDGEGASRTMRVEVIGAHTSRDAQRCARQVAQSPLVKTMLAGGDPNVGRIAGAVGAAQVQMRPERLEIHIGAQRMVSRGAACRVKPSVARRLLKRPGAVVRINLHAGSKSGHMLTCDLTEAYVRLNAEYTT